MEESLRQVADSARSMEESSEYEAADATEEEAEAVIRVLEFQLMFAMLPESWWLMIRSPRTSLGP